MEVHGDGKGKGKPQHHCHHPTQSMNIKVSWPHNITNADVAQWCGTTKRWSAPITRTLNFELSFGAAQPFGDPIPEGQDRPRNAVHLLC